MSELNLFDVLAYETTTVTEPRRAWLRWMSFGRAASQPQAVETVARRVRRIDLNGTVLRLDEAAARKIESADVIHGSPAQFHGIRAALALKADAAEGVFAAAEKNVARLAEASLVQSSAAPCRDK